MSEAQDERRVLPLQVGGTLPDNVVYITRPEDEQVFAILSEGTYCNILTSRQMGKSSLVQRVQGRLEAAGSRVLFVDLSALGGSQLRSPDAWYRSLLLATAMRMRAAAKFKTWWSGRPAEETMGTRFQAFVEDFLLAEPTPTVIVFDEVDATRDLGFTDDLFLSIRFLHNARGERSELKRITFCLVGVLAADDLIKSSTRTPYNIGHTIRLSDFARDDCDLQPLEDFLDRHGFPGAEVLDDVLTWTSGQPFLTAALCDQIARKQSRSVEALVRAEINNPTDFKVHFDRMEQIVRERIGGSSHVRARYLKMLGGRPVRGVPERDEESLLLAGLVRRESDGSLRLRNRIYALRFNKAWVQSILPAPPVPRWVWALVGVLASAAVAGSILWWRAAEDQKSQEAARREQTIVDGVTQINAADDDRAAREAWQAVRRAGIPPAEPRLVAAARGYWDRRTRELSSAAEALEGAGCTEEAVVMRAFIAARSGEPMPASPDGSPIRATSTLWLPTKTSQQAETVRCKQRRSESCDRVELSDETLSASCSGQLYIFHPEKPPQELTGRGNRRIPLSPDGAWSIGAVDEKLIVTHDKRETALAVCPAVGPPDPKHPSSVIDMEVHASGADLTIAHVCSDGTYGSQSISDLPTWFATVEKSNEAPRLQGGYGVHAVTWMGSLLVTARPGRHGALGAKGMPRVSVPYITALSSFGAAARLAAFGTEGTGGHEATSPPALGVIALDRKGLLIEQRWPFSSCSAPTCVVRRVAGGVHAEEVAGLVVGLDEQGQPSGTWVAFAGNGKVDAIDLGNERSMDVAVGLWQKELVAAVPLAGRIRLYSRDGRTDASWQDVQRRSGLTVRPEEEGRVERVDDFGIQQASRFEDVFSVQ